jgi:DNA-binding response OmpR family regulator
VPPVDEIATIVVCDGDQPTLDLLCEHLVEDRFKVLPAPSGTDALRLCRFNHPDLLILDLSLPDMAGIDVIQQIREGDRVDGRIAPNLPIVVFIQQGMGAGMTRSREFGADDYLQKPFSYPELRGRVMAVLRRSSAASAIGFPACSDSSAANSASASSNRSASFSKAFWRSPGVVSDQLANAFDAASTAMSTSAGEATGTSAICSPVAGA